MTMHQDVEAEAVDQTKQERDLAAIDRSLNVSRLRQETYEANGDTRSAEIEESVQDRLLRDRLVVMSR